MLVDTFIPNDSTGASFVESGTDPSGYEDLSTGCPEQPTGMGFVPDGNRMRPAARTDADHPRTLTDRT